MRLIFEDHFDTAVLDREKWLPQYLPHWSRAGDTAARYRIDDSVLRLFVAPDQEPWCPEFDGTVKVSGLQTGHFSGPVGTRIGQHRFRDGLVVRRELPTMRMFVPRYCSLHMRVRARLNARNLAALWLIGFEEAPDCSGEITVFEAFGHNVAGQRAGIGRGIKKLNDPLLSDEFEDSPLSLDIEDWHVYAMKWTPSGVDFFVDDQIVTRCRQSPAYPMQLMLNFYELPQPDPRVDAPESWFDVDYIRAFAEEGTTCR